MNTYGLRPGFTLDVTVDDDIGKPWDFNDLDQRENAKKLVISEKPWLLIGSPMCTWFSRLQNLNRAKLGEARFQYEYKRAVIHIEFCVDLHRIQMESGYCFLHEHPQTAPSWSLDCVIALLKDPRVGLIVADMCQFGMMQKDREGIEQYILKPTRWMSSALFVLHHLCCMY